MKKLLFLLISLLLFSCSESPARKPIYQSSDTFIKASIARNKKINRTQQKLFQQIIQSDTINYQSSPTGYWYSILHKSPKSTRPMQGDFVEFQYKIQHLDGKVIYDEMELGKVNYLVDKEDLLPALRYAVKDLREKEIGTFLVPSYLGFGYQGDGERIGINQPLRITIQLNSIKKINQSLDSK